VVESGFQVDALEIPGQAFDGAETEAGWTFTGGFRTTTGSESQGFFNAYVLENRQYIGYDLALLKGPYNFGFPAMPDKVEHFPYQDGLLISYWDNSQADNNVGDHPAIETWTEGTQMRPRIQSYDSTFTKTRTDGITLHNPATGVAKTIASKPAVSVFNDSLRDGDGTSIYWAPGHPSDAPANGRYQAEWNSVDVPNTGTVVISSSGMLVLDLNK
jgi:immune inhibitor A